MLHRSLDWLVKERLRRWPQRPPGIGGTAPWLRGRPADEELRCYPFLKLPGSAGWRTLPDGLWRPLRAQHAFTVGRLPGGLADGVCHAG